MQDWFLEKSSRACRVHSFQNGVDRGGERRKLDSQLASKQGRWYDFCVYTECLPNSPKQWCWMVLPHSNVKPLYFPYSQVPYNLELVNSCRNPRGNKISSRWICRGLYSKYSETKWIRWWYTLLPTLNMCKVQEQNWPLEGTRTHFLVFIWPAGSSSALNYSHDQSNNSNNGNLAAEK